MRKTITLVLLFSLALFTFAQSISVTRTIPQISATDQEFDVFLQIAVGDADPSGMIISESVPAGWEIVRSDDCVINMQKSLVKCITYGEDISGSLSYTLKSPVQKPEEAAVISGEWDTLTSSGRVTGAGLLEIIEPTAPPEPPPEPPPVPPPAQDNTLLIVLAALVVLLVVVLAYTYTRKNKKTAKK